MKFAGTYEEFKKDKPLGIRGNLRDIALDVLSFFDRMQNTEFFLRKPRVQFLFIHHAFKDEEHKLDALLKKLSRHHTFISYSEAVTKILENDIDKPYISVSSDDGLKNNLGAAEILNNYGVNVCFFINPGIMENLSFSDNEKYCRSRLYSLPVEFMDWHDIERLQKWGHEIGSHTMDHMNVADAETAYFAEDCKKTFEILKDKCGGVKHFAFPYGRFKNFNEKAAEVVFNTGFISCSTAERGCHVNGVRVLAKEELCILRNHLILDWDIDHIFHHIINNSKNARFNNNFYPFRKINV